MTSQVTKEYTRMLTEYLAALEPADLPAEVLNRARYFLLDYLGVAIRGSCAESSLAVQRMVARIDASGNATVIGTSLSTTPHLAALANGAAAHAIEMDDTHSGGSIHLGAVIYSAALAAAPLVPDASADRFFTAVVAGYEMSARLAMALQPKQHYALGFHPTATCGVFGAAVTVGRLLGLSTAQILHALGIAGSMAAGSMEFLAEGAWTKRIHPGFAAQNGIQAALLAREGFTGPQRVFEGRDGFLWSHSRNAFPERLTSDLGTTFEVMQTSVKPHACCRYMQGPIDAMLQLVRRHDIQPADVREIRVAVLEAGWSIVAEPRERKYHPASVVDAQFSMPFGAAIAVLERAAGLDQFSLDKILSPATRKLMEKVVLVKDLRLEENFPREWPARVVITLEDGRELETEVRYPKGDPENALSWEELKAKFDALSSPVLAAERRQKIVAAVSGAEAPLVVSLCARPSASAVMVL
jgi:2-methylcitrate dehydratase PrpD